MSRAEKGAVLCDNLVPVKSPTAERPHRYIKVPCPETATKKVEIGGRNFFLCSNCADERTSELNFETRAS